MTEMTGKLAKFVAKQFSAGEDFLENKKRNPSVTYAKKVMMYVLRHDTEMVLNDIAKVIGYKDHCTVIHHLQDVDGLLSYDEEFKAKVEDARTFYRFMQTGLI